MHDTERAALAARLEALERVIEGARAIAPWRGELDGAEDQEAARRLDRLLCEARHEILELRRRVRLPTTMERAAAACVPLSP